MISQQRAQELKDAGFPQREVVMHQVLRTKNERAAAVYMPTLEELIDACGNTFRAITKHYGQIGATNHVTPWYSAETYLMANNAVGPTGPTPTDAAAGLWLELHKKPDRCLCGQVPCPTCRGEDITKLELNKNQNAN